MSDLDPRKMIEQLEVELTEIDNAVCEFDLPAADRLLKIATQLPTVWSFVSALHAHIEDAR